MSSNFNSETLLPTQLKVLVSSASHKIPLVLALRSAAQRIDPAAQVVAGDLSGNSLAAYVADEFWVMPPTSDENLDAIIEGCHKRGINTVLPTRDGELQFWALHAELLAATGIFVIASPNESLKRCVDKLTFSNFGAAHGLLVIPASTNIDDLPADRYVVKERFGAGSRSIGMDLDREQAIAHSKVLTDPIFQPYIQGKEFSVDAWADRNHRVKGLVLRRRDKVVNGESQVTTTFSDISLETHAREVIEALALHGPVVLQALIDEAGAMHVIECNARFGGASTAGIVAGVDSLFWSLLEAHGTCVDAYPFIRIKNQVRQVRIPKDIYIYDSNI